MPTDAEHSMQLAHNQQVWDDFVHQVWDNVPVSDIRLADVLSEVFQVQGIAQAEHRGKPAYRLDLENVMSGGKGRLVLTTDNLVNGVKRYTDGDDRVTGPDSSVPPQPRSTVAVSDEWVLVRARAWAGRDGTRYDDDEQALFAFLCAGVEAYSRMSLASGLNDAPPGEQLNLENSYTLQAIAENICPGYGFDA